MVNSQYILAVIIHVLINSTGFSIITHIRVFLFCFVFFPLNTRVPSVQFSSVQSLSRVQLFETP